MCFPGVSQSKFCIAGSENCFDNIRPEKSNVDVQALKDLTCFSAKVGKDACSHTQPTRMTACAVAEIENFRPERTFSEKMGLVSIQNLDTSGLCF